MKKALFTLLMVAFMCGVISWIPIKADTPTNGVLSLYQGSTDKVLVYAYKTDDSGLNNDVPFNAYVSTVDGLSSWCKPVMFRYEYQGSLYFYLIAKPNTITKYIYYSDGSLYGSELEDSVPIDINFSFTDGNLSNYTFFDVPCFDNPVDAENYSLGLSFDSSHIIGGSIPIDWHFNNTETYNVVPKHFEKNFNFSSNGSTWNKDVAFTIKSWIVNPSEIPQGYEIMYDINMTYPTVDWLTVMYNSLYGNEFPTSIGLAMGVTQQFDAGVNSLLDGVVNTSSTFTYDFDWMATQSAYENYLTTNTVYDSIWADHKGEQTIILKEIITDNIFGNNSYCPNGFVSQLAAYYGDYQKACFALPYINVNWVGTYVINPSDGSVFDYYCTYYVDSIKSNGVVFERKGFNTQNSIDNEDIGSPSDTSGTTPSGTPKVTIPTSEMQSSYVSSIQDSYNNITNNYYYNNTYNQDLLDYLNKYKDGGQQEDIEDAFGYLDSTLVSLSNVPLLLGKLFNGFFPPAVVILLSAMFVIFVVFLIIRIIKHLFL